MSHLLEFYGEECPHCLDMHKLVVKLEKGKGIKVETLEVWHNEENEKRLLELDKDLCRGYRFSIILKIKNLFMEKLLIKSLKRG